MKTFDKQPSEILDYDIDLSRWLSDGDTITAVSTSATSGITIGAVTFTTSVVKVWVSGGTDKALYKITCVIDTAGGRRKEHDFRIRVNNE